MARKAVVQVTQRGSIGDEFGQAARRRHAPWRWAAALLKAAKLMSVLI
jgi:hypothetical protein